MLQLLSLLPSDVVNYHIAPELSELDDFCLDLALGRQRLLGRQYFPEKIHELLIKEGTHRYQYFNKLGMLDQMASMNYAAKYGQLDILQYGKMNKYVFNNKSVNNAAEHGHLECIKFLLTCGLSCSGGTLTAAVRGGHLHIVKYVMRKHKGRREGFVITAAKYGRLEVFMYLSHGRVDYFKDCFDVAIIGGHIPILNNLLIGVHLTTYHLQNGYDLAIEHKQYDVLAYLIIHNPYPQAYNIAIKYNNVDALQVLRDGGVLFPFHPMLHGANKEVLAWFQAVQA